MVIFSFTFGFVDFGYWFDLGTWNGLWSWPVHDCPIAFGEPSGMSWWREYSSITVRHDLVVWKYRRVVCGSDVRMLINRYCMQLVSELWPIIVA